MTAADASTRPLLGFRGDGEAALSFEPKAMANRRDGRSRYWTNLFGSLSVRQVIFMAVTACTLLSVGSFFVL